ncbi:MAG: hypothetical protein RSH52_33065, partial [Janthinobacterium sp.]
YIQLRDYTRVAEPAQARVDAVALDATTVSMIQSADTFFVASYVEQGDGNDMARLASVVKVAQPNAIACE